MDFKKLILSPKKHSISHVVVVVVVLEFSLELFQGVEIMSSKFLFFGPNGFSFSSCLQNCVFERVKFFF